jgi:hypothetical protein
VPVDEWTQLTSQRLLQEDVIVTVNDLSGQEKGEALVLEVVHISAQLKHLQWKLKQNYFPHMKGEGTADASASEASIRLGFSVKKREVPSEEGPPGLEPVVVLSSKHVSIGRIDLKVENCPMAWLYTLLAALFREPIREYIGTTTMAPVLTLSRAGVIASLSCPCSEDAVGDPVGQHLQSLGRPQRVHTVSHPQGAHPMVAASDLVLPLPTAPPGPSSPGSCKPSSRTSRPSRPRTRRKRPTPPAAA